MFYIEKVEDIKVPGGKRKMKAAIKYYESVDRAWRMEYSGDISRGRFRAAAKVL
jgi:ribosomal protein S24E